LTYYFSHFHSHLTKYHQYQFQLYTFSSNIFFYLQINISSTFSPFLFLILNSTSFIIHPLNRVHTNLTFLYPKSLFSLHYNNHFYYTPLTRHFSPIPLYYFPTTIPIPNSFKQPTFSTTYSHSLYIYYYQIHILLLLNSSLSQPTPFLLSHTTPLYTLTNSIHIYLY